MPHKIKKSDADKWPNFALSVQAYVAELRTWTEHMARVAADEKNGVVGLEKHSPYPGPFADPIIMSAVNEHGDVDFEIEDDGPSAEEMLQEKKRDLFRKVTEAEVAAVSALIPPGKQRMMEIMERDVRAQDFTRRISLADKLKLKARFVKNPETVLAKLRHPEETDFLKDQEATRSKIDAVHRAAAQMLHNIEDLMLDNVDAWVMPDFPN